MTSAATIALACGGTGGHIFPGLATANVLRRRGHRVVLWMAGKDVESAAVKGWPDPVVTIPSEGLPSGFSFRTLSAAVKMIKAVIRCRASMRNAPPDAVLAMGSYASIGPGFAALSLGIPLVLHEANVLPGRAISLLSRWATAVAGSFEETRFFLRRKDLVVTGMPMRADLEELSRSMPAPMSSEVFGVLVMGGSRGAHRLNAMASNAVCRVHQRGIRIKVIHLTGIADEAQIRSIYEKAGVPCRVSAFEPNMGPVYAEANLGLCRSGAATCAELCAFGVPSLLVPYPFATRDHQMANARAMEKMGVADVVPEKDLSEDWLADYMAGVIRNSERLSRMRTHAMSLDARKGAESLAGLVEQACARRSPNAKGAHALA